MTRAPGPRQRPWPAFAAGITIEGLERWPGIVPWVKDDAIGVELEKAARTL